MKPTMLLSLFLLPALMQSSDCQKPSRISPAAFAEILQRKFVFVASMATNESLVDALTKQEPNNHASEAKEFLLVPFGWTAVNDAAIARATAIADRKGFRPATLDDALMFEATHRDESLKYDYVVVPGSSMVFSHRLGRPEVTCRYGCSYYGYRAPECEYVLEAGAQVLFAAK